MLYNKEPCHVRLHGASPASGTIIYMYEHLLSDCDADFFFQILTVIVAIAVPEIGPFMTLIGAICLSTLGLIFPAIIEVITYWNDPGLGRFYWRLWKNVCLVAFGVIAFLTGTYVGIKELQTLQ